MSGKLRAPYYDLPGDLERQIGAFVDCYNNRRYYERFGNPTLASSYYQRDAKNPENVRRDQE